jgi:hypothetical protein
MERRVIRVSQLLNGIWSHMFDVITEEIENDGIENDEEVVSNFLKSIASFENARFWNGNEGILFYPSQGPVKVLTFFKSVDED